MLGISVARFAAPWGEIPVAATAEQDWITLYYWSPADRRWRSFRIEHAPLSVDGSTPDAPQTWNWSDRVAVACSRGTVHEKATGLSIQMLKPLYDGCRAGDTRSCQELQAKADSLGVG